MVLAVPTVQRRNQTYLTATLSNLFQCMDAGERADAVVVVFVGEVALFDVRHPSAMIATSFAVTFICPT